MRALAVVILVLSANVAQAADALTFDIPRLCQWQFDNNSMDIAECTALETESKSYVEANEGKVSAERHDACVAEARSFSGDSGYASYTVYATCLKDGPGSF